MPKTEAIAPMKQKIAASSLSNSPDWVKEVPAAREVNSSETKINIRPLKQLVVTKFPKDSVFFDVMTAEKDFLEKYEFVAKVDVWLKLLRRHES